MDDQYRTIAAPAEGIFKEKGSKFLAFAYPVANEAEIKERLAALRKPYYDASHHCYAFALGKGGQHYRANDDGEPSHSAGVPILGQIRSRELTNVLVVVVRYFGGTKLGVGGLIQAYKEAAALALDNAEIVSRYFTQTLRIKFEYPAMNDVMRVVKDLDLRILQQDFQLSCTLVAEVREGLIATLQEKLGAFASVETEDAGHKT